MKTWRFWDDVAIFNQIQIITRLVKICYTLFFLKEFRGWNLRHFKNISRINLRQRFWKEYNFVYIFLTKQCKIFPFSKRQNRPKRNEDIFSHMVDSNNIFARRYVVHTKLQCPQAGSKITPSMTPNTFITRNVIRYTIRI